MTAHLYRVIVPVGDVEAAQAFYAAVLGAPGRRVSPGRHYFDCGGTILACFDPRADGDERDARANPECVYLAVDDLEASHAACAAAPGAAGLPGPIGRRPWGEESFYLGDPWGNPLCFVRRGTVFRG